MDGARRIVGATLFVFFILLISMNNSRCSGKANVSCIESEREALIRVKQDLYDPSNRLASWVGKDCCGWNGIVCDQITGHVHKLQLGGPPIVELDPVMFNAVTYLVSLLGGVLNPSLADLKHLRHLDLSNSNFGRRKIPNFLGSLRSLRYLNLSQAGFSGVIPPQLGNLTDLRYLDLGSSPYSNITGFSNGLYTENVQWVSHLSWLQYLDMSGVDFGQQSDWLQVTNSLPSLVALRLSRCNLNFKINPLIYHVNVSLSLEILDLSFNNIAYSTKKDHTLSWIFKLRSLASLDLSANDFSEIPEGIQNMTSLKHLDLTANYISTSLPIWLFRLSHLEFLSLQDNQLKGTISSDISNLTSLATLDLSINDFKEFPTSIGQLCELKKIDLSANRWGCEISQVIDIFSRCASDVLEHLDLSSSNISGQLTDQIALFKTLTYLSLSSNSISGPIPVSIGNLSSLRYLDLADNRINETLPQSTGQLVNLERLLVSENLIAGIVSEAHFANATKLRRLIAHGNPLSLRVPYYWVPCFQLDELSIGYWRLDEFPLWLRSQKRLRSVDMSNTGLASDLPSWFWSFSSLLYDVDLSHNQMHGRIVNISTTGTRQSIVDLSHNLFEGSLPRIPANVVKLDLSYNLFSGSISPILCKKMMSDQPLDLQVLNLANNRLSGNLPNCSSRFQNLIDINLNYNRLSGSIPSYFGSMLILESLHLRNNSFYGSLPLSLQNCTLLDLLDLGGNRFGGSIPGWIGTRLTKMKTLSLSSNDFRGPIPHELCALSSLRILDLSHNSLSGPIPKCFYNFSSMALPADIVSPDKISLLFSFTGLFTDFLKQDASAVIQGRIVEYREILYLVRIIDLSANALSGDMPTEITSLKSLISLNLSRNLLTGEIPEKISEMKALISLDFSKNKLSGRIPTSMSTMSFLSHLNLSYNNLTGEIPSGTQLQTFDEYSFIGNTLCGPPLPNNCINNNGTHFDNQKKMSSDEEYIDMSWFYMGMGLGFATSFWGVCGAIFLNRRWRHCFFRLLGCMSDRIYVAWALTVRRFHDKLRSCRLIQ